VLSLIGDGEETTMSNKAKRDAKAKQAAEAAEAALKEEAEVAQADTTNRRLTSGEFTVRAITRLRKPPFKGIHSVYSGFNKAYRQYFGTDPVAGTTELEASGVITGRPVKGGRLLYLPDQQPIYDPSRPKEDQPVENPVLTKIIIGGETE